MNLNGKKALVLGLANQRSIAWGICQKLKEAGAELILSYLPVLEKRVLPLAEELGVKHLFPCDVGSDDEIKQLAKQVQEVAGEGLEALVHSLAYAEREDLERDFVYTTRQGFLKAMDVSAYSLVALCRELLPCLEKKGGSVLCLTYYGSEKVVKNYNVMGVAKAALEASVRYLANDLGPKKIRVNAISAGPIRTLAASGVKDFKSILSHIEEVAPLRRNISIEEVGNLARFLCSDEASAITGELVHIDSGFHILSA
ncbi:MAG: enoyl-ACP reductase [Bradymonadales bacterium]|nr:MAG: enoyl-ACP reductase [Bradymonadales bacterium]